MMGSYSNRGVERRKASRERRKKDALCVFILTWSAQWSGRLRSSDSVVVFVVMGHGKQADDE